MRIGIDARVMTPEASGIGRYSIEMVSALAALPESASHQFLLFPGEKTIRLDLPDNWTYFTGKLPAQGVKRAFFYPKIVKPLLIDRFYTMDYLGPICPMPCKSIVTVHDLIPIICPEVTTLKHRIVGRLLLPRSIRTSSVIISVSQSTKNDIVERIGISPDKVNVVYNGVNPSFHSSPSDTTRHRDILDRYHIGTKPYLLFLGTLEPKKNLVTLVKAYAELDNKHRESHNLVLCGKLGWDNTELSRLIHDKRLEKNVIFTGFAREEHLPVLYSCATAFCFPSLYEGFGLPIAEAMACGCPVITSNISSMPEIAGDAALLVDPYDCNGIADAITRLLEDEELRAELKKKSQIRSTRFTWETASQKVLGLITSP